MSTLDEPNIFSEGDIQSQCTVSLAKLYYSLQYMLYDQLAAPKEFKTQNITTLKHVVPLQTHTYGLTMESWFD